MRLLILAMFCLGVNANCYQNYNDVVLRPGLAVLCGQSPVKKTIGPIEDNGKPCTENRVDKFAVANGDTLKDNEEVVRNKKNLVYPCSLKDCECIRQFFGENCNCKPVYGSVTDPLYISQNIVFVQNASATYSDVEFRGLSNATIYSFYYNKKTGYVILSIKLPKLTVSTPNLCFVYHRPGKESIVKCDCANITYKSLIFTAEIPGMSKCRLDLADIHGYVDDSNVDFFIGPNAYKSTDPTVKKVYAALLKNIPRVIQDNMLFQSQLFLATYIQSNICDFNLEICSI